MSYQAVTLADLQTQLSARVEGNPWWTADESRLALNEGLRIWNAMTAQWVMKIYGITVPNDPYIPIPATLCRASRVLWNAIPLEKCSQADLDLSIPGWRGATTTTAGHPSRPVYWAPVALNLFTIYPADADGFGAVEIAGVHQTPLLTLPGDFVDLGQEEHDLLLAYAKHVLTFKVGGPRFVASYDGWLGLLKAAAAENRQLAASAYFRRLLGLDQQRRLRVSERPVQNPVDQALQQDAASLGSAE